MTNRNLNGLNPEDSASGSAIDAKQAAREAAERKAAEFRAKAQQRAAQTHSPVEDASNQSRPEIITQEELREEPAASKSEPPQQQYAPQAEKLNPFIPQPQAPGAGANMMGSSAAAPTYVPYSGVSAPNHQQMNAVPVGANPGNLKQRKRLVGLILGFPISPLPMFGLHHFYFRRPGKGILHIILFILWMNLEGSAGETWAGAALLIWIVVSFIRIMANTNEYKVDGKGVPTVFV